MASVMALSSWIVELSGDQGDLALLSQWYSGEYGEINQENGSYFLDCNVLLGCGTPQEAIRHAETRLELIIAAAHLESGDEPFNVKLGSAVFVDADGIYHYHLETAIRVGISTRSWDSTPCVPSRFQRHVLAAEGDSHLDIALRLWGDSPRTWPRLYRILEDICRAFADNEKDSENAKKEDVSKLLYDKKLIPTGFEKEDILRFKYSACEARVAGRDSRHALGFNQIPKHIKNLSDPEMPYPRAVMLVGGVLRLALERKWEDRLKAFPESSGC